MATAFTPPRPAETPVDPATYLVGDSAAMAATRALVRRVAMAAVPVLVTGPSGSGKEMVARAIHAAGPRRAGPLVPVNCGAIPSELIESELFGHEKGAFTGAVAQRRGRFEQASGGTLFLDEIGEMPAAMQVRLLRVLEEGSVERVGGTAPIALDTRIIAATHRDLDAAIADGRLREDLYYRLSVVRVELPSLSERIEDLPALIAHLAARGDAALPRPDFLPDALARLMAHDWPGNVRELRNVVDRARVLFGDAPIDADAAALLLPASRRPAPSTAADACPDANVIPLRPNGTVDLRAMVLDLERRHIIAALDAAQGVVADAARLVSLNRTTFLEKMRRHAVSRPGGEALAAMH